MIINTTGIDYHRKFTNSLPPATLKQDSSRNNADEIKSTQVGKFGNIALYSSDEESEEEADSESLDGTEEATCRYSRNGDAEKEAQEKKGPSLTKIPSRKEKEQMKSKDLDDLDDILNEFGIAVQPAKDNSNPEAKIMISTNELEDEEEKSGKKKKKKKKKKQSDTADIITDDALAEAPADDGDVPPLTTNSVAAVIKAKAPTKKKSPAEIAAATAAKEAKAKKETEIKKKKKKKDKFLHGGVQR